MSKNFRRREGKRKYDIYMFFVQGRADAFARGAALYGEI